MANHVDVHDASVPHKPHHAFVDLHARVFDDFREVTGLTRPAGTHSCKLAQVIPGLFISKFEEINEADSFTKKGMNVGLVVNAGIAGSTTAPTSTGFYGPGVEVLTIDLLDDPTPGDAKQHFLPTNAQIKATLAAGEQVVVHCVASVSRGPVFIIAYLMQFHHLAAYEAATLLKTVWDAVWPNDAFVRQLLAFEYELIAPERAITGPTVRSASCLA
jgi:protein-tyrosine phosphatase